MKISKEKSHLLFGILLGGFVLLHSVNHVVSTENQKQQTEQSEGEDQPEVTVTQAQAVPHAGQISLGFESYLLEEVTYREDQEGKRSIGDLAIPSTRKAIRILLRKIISPNAP